jgi:tRNA pseudouridine13 synthase
MSEFLYAWSYAYGGPLARAVLRHQPEDFRVTEIMNIARSGAGEHLWLRLRKRLLNTADVAQQLARLAGVKPADVGYAGLKDKYAITEQWFSITLPGRPDPDFSALDPAAIQILQTERHSRKLQRGALSGNCFIITLRNIKGKPSDIDARLRIIATHGVPNYYGEQRFGHDGNNVTKFIDMTTGKLRERNPTRRGLYISAARSYVFNRVLAVRVQHKIWDEGVDGDPMQLHNASAVFRTEQIDDVLRARLAQGDIHPTAPLWGCGESMAQFASAELEQTAVQGLDVLCNQLTRAGLRAERRATRLMPASMQWRWLDGETLALQFDLPAGAYATTVLREVFDYHGFDVGGINEP